jgi:hypothetical protein
MVVEVGWIVLVAVRRLPAIGSGTARTPYNRTCGVIGAGGRGDRATKEPSDEGTKGRRDEGEVLRRSRTLTLEQALFTCSVRNRVFPGVQEGLAGTLDCSVT